MVVSWHHDRWLPSCLASIPAAASTTVSVASVTVVDNASTLKGLHTPAGIGGLTLLSNSTNAGFAPACNQGARLGTSEFLLFLNPDTRLRPGALTHAVTAMRMPSSGDVGLLGLQLVDGDGRVQRTCGRFPRLSTAVSQLLGLSRIAPRACPGFRMTEWDHTATRRVDFACGAALLVRRSVFEDLGGFDEALFLYLEDADLSLRARSAGWQTLFCADARVEHACGWSGGTDRAWRLAQSWRSLLVYASTHFSRVQAWLLAVVLWLAAPLARVVESAVCRTPRGARDAVAAWFLLLRLLAAERRHGARGPAVTPEGDPRFRPATPAPRQA